MRLDKKSIAQVVLLEKSSAIYNGDVIIDVRKRYYDDEIEYFAFVPVNEFDKENPQFLFDAVDDGFYLREIIGDVLYNKIQDQSYFFRNITEDEMDTKAGYFFDIKLNLIDPELMFWSTTSNNKNKYLLSLFGQWGSDKIYLPGWAFSEYMMGVKLTYHSILSDDPRDYDYSLSIGTGVGTQKPFSTSYSKVPLNKTGESLFLKLSGNPFKYIFSGLEHMYLDIESMVTLLDYNMSEYGFTEPVNFYSVRNYFSASVKKRNIFNLFDLGYFEFGLGLTSHDLYRFEYEKGMSEIKDLNENKGWFDRFENIIQADIGVSRTGGLIQHNLNFLIGYNYDKGTYSIGVNTKFMISDTFGFDIRYVSSMGETLNSAPWKKDAYLIFSPVLRINY